MRKLAVKLRFGPSEELLVGNLLHREHRIFFEYHEEFLSTGWELSPWKLPAGPGLAEHRDRGFGPLPGLFDDSLPDGWGLLLMDRRFQALGRDLAVLSPLDRLAYLGSRTMGALTYHPPEEPEVGGSSLDLGLMARASSELLRGTSKELLPELLRAGGSPGGARPKVLVGVQGEQLLSGESDLPEGFEPWMVKFPAREDGPDTGRIELAYARMARLAGITMPPTRGFDTPDGERHFGVQRFDRQPGNRRLHIHTLGGLIHADHRVPSCDYDHLLRVARALTRDHRALVECFRRMVFNVCAANRDDHVKNFAFSMGPDGEWSMSPAYDLVPAPGPGGEHQMTIDGEGREPDRSHCLSLANRHDIAPSTAREIFDQVEGAVARFSELALEEGSSRDTVSRIVRTHRRLST